MCGTEEGTENEWGPEHPRNQRLRWGPRRSGVDRVSRSNRRTTSSLPQTRVDRRHAQTGRCAILGRRVVTARPAAAGLAGDDRALTAPADAGSGRRRGRRFPCGRGTAPVSAVGAGSWPVGCHEPAHAMLNDCGLARGCSAPLRTSSVPRRCRASGRAGALPSNLVAGALMVDRGSVRLHVRLSPAEHAGWHAEAAAGASVEAHMATRLLTLRDVTRMTALSRSAVTR